MLCPNCGAEVGESIRLCDNCQAERDQRKREEEEAAAAAAAAAQAQAQSGWRQRVEPVSDEGAEPGQAAAAPAPRSALPMILGGIVVALLLVLGAVYALRSTPEELPASSTTPQDDPQREEPLFIPVIQATLQAGDEVVSFSAVNARYNPLSRQLQISLSESTEIGTEPAAIIFTLHLSPAAADCSADAVTKVETAIRKPSGSYQFSESFTYAADQAGLLELSCTLANQSELRAHFQQTADRIAAGTTTPLRWDVQISTKLNVLEPKAEVSFDSADAKAQVALLNREGRLLEIGLFPQQLSPIQRAEVREQRSLFALEEIKPLIVASFDLQPNVKELELAALTKYGVTFIRNEEADILFPGEQERLSFYYVPPPAPNDQISGLRGGLYEGETINGALQHSAKKDLSGAAFTFNWKLDISAQVIDISADRQLKEPTKAAGAGTAAPPPAQGETRARVVVDGAAYDFTQAFALFYAEEGDLAIGFYQDQLSEAEKAEVATKRSFWTYVNNKRPNFVIFLDFKRDSDVASPETLLEYTVHYQRDKLGGVYFPGTQDMVSIKRSKPEPAEGEIREVSGRLVEGGSVRVRFKGDHVGKKSGIKYSWDLIGTVPVVAVK